MSDISNNNNHLRASKSLPDFDTLRDMAQNDPDGLESLRVQLCNKVIDEAPEHAKQRLRGLMFQINAKRQIAASNLEAAQSTSKMMSDSLLRMQQMLRDLRQMQSESILLNTRHNRSDDNGDVKLRARRSRMDTSAQTELREKASATIIPFHRR